jgi:hypothetical protein
MFNFFKKKVLNPLISKTVGEMDDALKAQNVTDRIENLLSAKEASKTSFLKISNREGIQGSAALLLMIGGFVAFVGLGSPLIGALALAGIAGFAVKKSFNTSATRYDAKNIGDRIDAQVSNLATAHPQEALKSPRFLKALKERFNVASASETEVNQLRLALAPPPAAIRGFSNLVPSPPAGVFIACGSV